MAIWEGEVMFREGWERKWARIDEAQPGFWNGCRGSVSAGRVGQSLKIW